MADDKKKTGLSERVNGLFIDKILTFGGGLQFKQSDIDNAVNAIDAETDINVDSYKDIKTQEDLINLKKFLTL